MTCISMQRYYILKYDTSEYTTTITQKKKKFLFFFSRGLLIRLDIKKQGGRRGLSQELNYLETQKGGKGTALFFVVNFLS